MEDRSRSDRAIDVSKEHEIQQENSDKKSYLKFDWFHRHSQLRHTIPETMKNPESLTFKSPETSPKFFRRSFDIHMLRPETDIYDTTYRSLSDSELDKPNDSSMTAEFMDLPRKLPKRLSLHTKRSYDIKDRPGSLQNRRAGNTTSGFNLPTSVPKIEFSNVHVVVEDIDDERSDMSSFYIGDSNYTCDDYSPGNSGMWMGLEPQSHSLLSPRSSNGSICSYRSSNADSAIEILTPDEEIPDHSPTESSDSRFWENRQSTIKTSSHNTLESVHSPGAIHFIPGSNQTTHTHCSGDDTIPSHFSVSYTDPHASSSSVPSRLETIYRSEISISPSDVHNRSYTKSSPTSSTIFSYKSSIQQPSSVLGSVTQSSSSTFDPKKLVPSPQPTTPFQGRSLPPQSVPYKQGSSLQTSANLAQVPSRSIPPSVVISDFSNRFKLKDKGSQTVDSESGAGAGPFTSYLTEGMSYVRRSLSNCSISSNESSTFSVPSDSSQDVEEAPVRRRPKTSSWKKIRNIVHWSPFIQQFKRRKYPWIQLAGHQGNFQAGDPGAILKKYDKREHTAFKKLMKDVLRPYVPDYRGEASKDGDRYVQLQDLLCEFEAPCVMDMKMGCRTYLEEELVKARENPSLRKDMYQKMVEVDPMAPTEEEHNQKAITKPRYMQWRDDMSSSSEMGYRIEGIRKSDGAQVKNFKKTKDKNSVKECLKLFVEENPLVVSTYLRRLKAIRATQEFSPFFKSHETIGSSLLFVHDRGGQASIWMIDFGKTVPLPENVSTTHRNKWIEGNHEDGYLYGMDRLIEIFDELNTEYCNSETDTSDYQCKTMDTETSIDTHPQHQKDTSDLISVHNTETGQSSSTIKDDGTSATV